MDPDPFLAQIAPLRDALRAVVLGARDVRHPGRPPDAESRAMSELAAGEQFGGDWSAHPAQDDFHHAGILLMAAEDHILAMCSLFDRLPAPVYAHVVLARAAMEASIYANWLLDLSIDAQRRVGRYMTLRLVDQQSLARFGDREEFQTVARAHDRIAAIVAQAERVGLQVRRDRNRKPLWIGERLPDMVELAEAHFLDGPDGEPGGLGTVLWRFFCAIAHGSLHGLVQGIGAGNELDPIDPSIAVASFVTSSSDVQIFLATTSTAYVPAMTAFVHLMGRPESEYFEKLQHLTDTIQERYPSH